MKHLFFVLAVLFLGGVFCSCAHTPEPPVYLCRFHTEKDAFMPNGWRFLDEDGLYAKPKYFEVKSAADKKDERANTFSVTTGSSPVRCFYCGFYAVEDDSIIDVVANAAGKGSFSLGVDFFDADHNLIGERHQGFNLPSGTNEQEYKTYRFRLYFLANENGKARFVRLMFMADPFSSLTLRDILLDIKPYEVDRMDSTYIKFKEKEAKQGRK